MMYVGFQKWIPASRDKNINFEEVRWYQQIYTCFTLWKYQFWWSRCFSRNVYLIQVIQISILMKYGDFQKCIPVSWDQNINFEEFRWYQQIYTCFTLWKYQFWWRRCFFRNVYLIQVIQISIFIKYVDFQNCIHVSGYKNINFDDVRWIPEMNTCFTGSKY